jgi:hypothetical protein
VLKRRNKGIGHKNVFFKQHFPLQNINAAQKCGIATSVIIKKTLNLNIRPMA